jgi:hypothetical protein
VLTAEDSTVMAKKDHRSRPACPQASEADGVAVNIGKRDSGQLAAERVGHAGILRDGERSVKQDSFTTETQRHKEELAAAKKDCKPDET